MGIRHFENPVREAHRLGQSIWLDYLSRDLIESGRLGKAIEQGVRGITSNPKIFSSAFREGDVYDEAIASLNRQGKKPLKIYETLAIEDVQSAADALRPYFGRELPHDGFVSLEVSPRLARDTGATIDEGRRLWRAVDRPNVLIKVPATTEGLPAIRTLISEGVNVNVTLLFSLKRYREVAAAYIEGLEDAHANGLPLERIHSVASFFLSRIDVLVDAKLEEAGVNDGLRGKAAIASAKLAYHTYQGIFAGDRFRKLRDAGAEPQRLLWASTSTKDPGYSDVKYVDALIGPETVNTVPEKTFAAFLDHGDAKSRLTQGIQDAQRALDRLAEAGVDMQAVTDQLVVEGVRKFVEPFEELLEGLREKVAA